MKKKNIRDFAFFGGEKLFNTPRTTMNLVKPNREVFFQRAKISFDAKQMTNNGPNVRELENQLATLHNTKYCVAFANDFMSMVLGIKVLALEGKTEVILPSLTYKSMTDIVRLAGFKPVFCDIDESNLALNPQTVLSCINENTALILAPHPMVYLNDIEGLEALAKSKSIPLFFDSAEAMLAEYKNRMIGSFGHAEAFSMHSSKILNASEGGYITTNDENIAHRLKIMRAFGFEGQDNIVDFGINIKLNEIHAAMALSCLTDLPSQIDQNKALHFAYQKALKGVEGLEVISYNRQEKRNWKSCLVRITKQWKLDREFTLALLNAENIEALAYYSPALHEELRGEGQDIPFLPVTEKLSHEYFILPFGSTVSLDDAEKIGFLLKDIKHNALELQVVGERNEN